MKTVIDFSETETKCLGVKIGRYNTQSIEPEKLKEAIEEGKYDVVRVRTNATDDLASLKLSQTGYPFYFNGGIRRYKVDCIESPLPPFTSPDVNFELFTGQGREILKQILSEGMGDSPIGYYRTPPLAEKISKSMEVTCLHEYYFNFNNNTVHPNNYLWFMKLGSEYVGFIALNVYRENDMVDSTLAGFLKDYQSKGLFPNILRHIRKFCRENQLTYFCCGARLENLYSQWAFEKDYMKAVGIDYVFHVTPFLSANR